MSVNSNAYDAIIVGSGAGGSAAAYSLAKAGMRVLMLEKGSWLPQDGSTLDVDRVVHRGEFKSRAVWRDRKSKHLVPEEYFNVGGKTKWYGAALARFGDEEFGPDVAHQCPGWPFDASELKPWYERAEKMLGVRNFASEEDLARLLARIQKKENRWHASALPMGLKPEILQHRQEAQHFDGFASPLGLKVDGEQAFLGAARRCSNFTLVTQDEVTSLLTAEGQPLKVIGVQTASGKRYLATSVLLAAGALHSPRLLQRHIDHHQLTRLPIAASVGRFLKLHLLTAVLAVARRPQRDLIRKTMLLTHDDVRHSSIQPLGFDGELLSTLVPGYVPRRIAELVGARAYGFFLQTEDGSSPANRVIAGAGNTPPTLDYDSSRLPPASVEHRRLVRLFRRSLFSAGYLNFSQSIGLNGTAHACGTLRAGTDSTNSVVDGDGRVFGMEGLLVVDGSVLPRSSRVNPALSIYAFSLRAADRLAKRQGIVDSAKHSMETIA